MGKNKRKYIKGNYIYFVSLIVIMAMISISCVQQSDNVTQGDAVNHTDEPIGVTENEQNTVEGLFKDFSLSKIVINENNTASPIPYEAYAEFINEAGPPKDGIPPIDNPVFDMIEEADEYLNDDDYVFVYEHKDNVYAFAQKILVYHEIVNLNFEGDIHAVTYCPLTGSCIGYENELPTGDESLGTSGSLLNSNLVMYDRATDSYYPQILGENVNGEEKGKVLDTFPVHWVLWKDFKINYEEAKVLSLDTGHIRNYEEDPYGSYKESDFDNYYHNDSVWFHVMNRDETMTNKEIVVAIKLEDKEYALEKNIVLAAGSLNFELNTQALLAVYDPSIDTVRIYNDDLDLIWREGVIASQKNQMKWSINGKGLDGQPNLTSPTYFDVFWFAWVAYYPDTGVVYYDE